MQDKTIEIEFVVDAGKLNHKRQVTFDSQDYERLKKDMTKPELGKKKVS